MSLSPSTSSAPAVPPRYEYLKSLSDIRHVRDLDRDAVRDILRNYTSDHGLEVVEMGEITDMSGLNDAFNSTICSLRCKVKFSRKRNAAGAAAAAANRNGGGGANAAAAHATSAASTGSPAAPTGSASSSDSEDKEFTPEAAGGGANASAAAAAGANASTDGDDDLHEYNFVIKSPPKMNFIRMVHKLSKPFFNEVSWYLDLVPQAELANGRGAMSGILADCFHAYSSNYSSGAGGGEEPDCCVRSCPWWCWVTCKSPESGVLILENVKLREGRSYKMYDKRKPLPLEHVRLIFTELAHFHGKWTKWIHMAKAGKLNKDSKVEPMSYEAFKNTYNTQKRIPTFLYRQLKNVAKKSVITILKKAGTEEQENIRKCKVFFDRVAIPKLREYLARDPSPFWTLTHGDFWSNNILFSYHEERKAEVPQGTMSDTSANPSTASTEEQEERRPRDLILIDFQLINYGHPAYDLVYFTYLNTDLAFRDAHLESVLRTYHTTFSSYLRECEEFVKDPKELEYTFEQFMKDFEEHRPLGFTTACSVMPNVMSDTQVDLETTGLLALRELQRKQLQELKDDTNASGLEIRRRIRDMVHEMARDKLI